VLRALLDELQEGPNLAARVKARIWAAKRLPSRRARGHRGHDRGRQDESGNKLATGTNERYGPGLTFRADDIPGRAGDRGPQHVVQRAVTATCPFRIRTPYVKREPCRT
jgi:hypothetical protein